MDRRTFFTRTTAAGLLSSLPAKALPEAKSDKVIMAGFAGGTGAEEEPVNSSPATVKIVREGEIHRLMRNGQPYFIKGGGGWKYLDRLKTFGGNSIRTWGAPTDGELLDEANTLGLTVTFGIWLGHKDQGFSYDNPKQVKEQFEKSLAIVQKYKDHPALLIWGIGNEMEGVEGMENGWADPEVWKAVEDIAHAIKQSDPHHPVITVVAEFNEAKIAAIKRHCPSLEALGINSYGAMPTLPARLKQAGWEKPYIITEFGPVGPWQTQKTAWGAPIEEISTQKAYDYLARYDAAVASQPQQCLGSYVYLWGYEEHEVSTTHTWFALFLPEAGEPLEAVDAMTLAWTGQFPQNRAPEILLLESDISLQQVPSASFHAASVVARDPDGDPIKVRWEVRAESSTPPTVATPVPVVVPNCIVGAVGDNIKFNAPGIPGAYRLFVYIYDNKGSAATGNVPFLVKGQSS